MELVAPAGNLEKLEYAWQYGADAAYIGLKSFSLRVKADNFHGDEFSRIKTLKEEYAKRGQSKRLFCALNITFHDSDMDAFLAEADYFAQYPFDAFIIQDIGMVPLLQTKFPSIPLHLSTQANCINSRSVMMYKDLGFKRVVLGRETSLTDIRRIKDNVPEMEIECFVHGAMCIAYSGRCLMSAYMAGRSANKGLCSHSCRWEYRYVEEKERPGEYFPVIEGDGFTTIFASKDLCMIDHLEDMKRAGIDSLKIEGRMKSLYYTALVTRAYRKALDALEGNITAESAKPFIAELDNVPHRETGTGFYYSREDADKTTRRESSAPYLLAGTIGKLIDGDKGLWEFISLNKITAGTELEFLGPDSPPYTDQLYTLINPANGEQRQWVCHGHPCLIHTTAPVYSGWIVRARDPSWTEKKGTEQCSVPS